MAFKQAISFIVLLAWNAGCPYKLGRGFGISNGCVSRYQSRLQLGVPSLFDLMRRIGKDCTQALASFLAVVCGTGHVPCNCNI